MLGAVGVVSLLALTIVSFGWFTGLITVKGKDAAFAASNGVFELAAENQSGKYDALLNSPSGEALSGIVFEDGTPANLIATSDGKPEIKWLMNDESNFGNLSGDGIQPGSSGKLSFYVIAKQNGDLALRF